jgi:hypothetical protein
MKKIISTLLFVSSLLFGNQIFAQACGNSGPSICTPSGQFFGGGFENPDSTPCVVQAVAYNYAIQFTMYSAFFFPGVGQVAVDSVEFNSLSNLPCGLCWATTKTNNRYAADEDGCIKISGVTNDPIGQYKLALTLKAWINGGSTPISVPASLVDQTPIKMFLRVKAAVGNCPGVDTSQAANNLIASTTCPTSVNDLSKTISDFNILPNPLNTEGVVSFLSEKSALYTVRISDATGKLVSSREIEARQGTNSVSIERNNLSIGIYFVSLGDGKNLVTRKFSITE